MKRIVPLLIVHKHDFAIGVGFHDCEHCSAIYIQVGPLQVGLRFEKTEEPM